MCPISSTDRQGCVCPDEPQFCSTLVCRGAVQELWLLGVQQVVRRRCSNVFHSVVSLVCRLVQRVLFGVCMSAAAHSRHFAAAVMGLRKHQRSKLSFNCLVSVSVVGIWSAVGIWREVGLSADPGSSLAGKPLRLRAAPQWLLALVCGWMSLSVLC
jgi:hypothetical protein